MCADSVGCVDPKSCEDFCENAVGCSNIAYPKLVLELLPVGQCVCVWGGGGGGGGGGMGGRGGGGAGLSLFVGLHSISKPSI